MTGDNRDHEVYQENPCHVEYSGLYLTYSIKIEKKSTRFYNDIVFDSITRIGLKINYIIIIIIITTYLSLAPFWGLIFVTRISIVCFFEPDALKL